jgi:hypothetical protein
VANDRPRSGRPRITNHVQDRYIRVFQLRNRTVTASQTASNIPGLRTVFSWNKIWLPTSLHYLRRNCRPRRHNLEQIVHYGVYRRELYHLVVQSTASQTASNIPGLRRISAQTVWCRLPEHDIRARRPYFDAVRKRQLLRARDGHLPQPWNRASMDIITCNNSGTRRPLAVLLQCFGRQHQTSTYRLGISMQFKRMHFGHSIVMFSGHNMERRTKMTFREKLNELHMQNELNSLAHSGCIKSDYSPNYMHTLKLHTETFKFM